VGGAVSRRNALRTICGSATAAAIATSLQCGSIKPARAADPPAAYSAGTVFVDVTRDRIRVRRPSDPARSLWETEPGHAFLADGAGKAAIL
jgi:hypothetical protein